MMPSQEFTEAFEVLLKQHDIHSAVLCWVMQDSDDPEVVAGEHLLFGCPNCAGRILAHTAFHLEDPWKEAFSKEFSSQVLNQLALYAMPAPGGSQKPN